MIIKCIKIEGKYMSKKILTATLSLSIIALALTGCKTGIEDPKGDKVEHNAELIISEPVVPVDEGFSEENVDRSLANVNVSGDAFVQVIGSFDNALTNGWSATGAFLSPASEDAWRGTTGIVDFDPPGAAVGLASVSTCEINNNAEGCDAPVGTLTSPLFRINEARTILNFLMAGGNGTAPVGMRVLDSEGVEIGSYTPDTVGLHI